MSESQELFNEAEGITAANDDAAANAIEVSDRAVAVSVFAIVTAGSPTTGAKLQVSLDGTNWIDENVEKVADFSLRSNGSLKKVRLAVTDGTWTLQRKQTLDMDVRS